MFNILPQIDISSVCSWEKIIALCVYVNDDEAPAVRVIFDKISKGESYNQVITELKRLGYTTRNGQPFSYRYFKEKRLF